MTKPVIISLDAWRKIRQDLHKQYPKSVFALRSKMKAVLGFTAREHRSWQVNSNYEREYYVYQNQKKDDLQVFFEPQRGYYVNEIHLDFYSDNKRTMFLLKYSDFINKAENEKR